VNGVNEPATKGEKILLAVPAKRGKNYRLATKKLTEIYRKPTKVSWPAIQTLAEWSTVAESL